MSEHVYICTISLSIYIYLCTWGWPINCRAKRHLICPRVRRVKVVGQSLTKGRFGSKFSQWEQKCQTASLSASHVINGRSEGPEPHFLEASFSINFPIIDCHCVKVCHFDEKVIANKFDLKGKPLRQPAKKPGSRLLSCGKSSHIKIYGEPIAVYICTNYRPIHLTARYRALNIK